MTCVAYVMQFFGKCWLDVAEIQLTVMRLVEASGNDTYIYYSGSIEYRLQLSWMCLLVFM